MPELLQPGNMPVPVPDGPYNTVGCRAAAFLQKLPWRREVNSGDRFGLPSC